MNVDAGLPTSPALNRLSGPFQKIGAFLLRYGLVAILLLVGLQKWTKAEAEGIQPWIAHSPFLFWLYHVTSVQGASIAIGVIEVTTAVLIALRHWLPRISALGSALAIPTFLITLSFLFTSHNDPASQGFLMKDIFLLGSAAWSCGEALRAARP